MDNQLYLVVWCGRLGSTETSCSQLGCTLPRQHWSGTVGWPRSTKILTTDRRQRQLLLSHDHVLVDTRSDQILGHYQVRPRIIKARAALDDVDVSSARCGRSSQASPSPRFNFLGLTRYDLQKPPEHPVVDVPRIVKHPSQLYLFRENFTH